MNREADFRPLADRLDAALLIWALGVFAFLASQGWPL